MSYLSALAKAAGIALAVWSVGRAIRTAHPLDRAGATLRWTVVVVSASTYAFSLRTHAVPDGLLWTAIFAFTLFFFLPDVSYYLVLWARIVIARFRQDHAHPGDESRT
jgi:hypothetical protein